MVDVPFLRHELVTILLVNHGDSLLLPQFLQFGVAALIFLKKRNDSETKTLPRVGNPNIRF